MNKKTNSDFIKSYTDSYFLKSKEIIEKNGDISVTYAVFIRRPGIVALKLAIDWIKQVAKERKINIQTTSPFKEGEYFGAGEPILFIKGSFKHLVDLETLFLQKIGPACIAAANAYQMCMDLPKTSFIAMDARHCAGSEMAELMAYGASVGSRKAKIKMGAKGFIGCATDATAKYFDTERGIGTMPHALIGYAGSTVKAAKMFRETFPDKAITVLVDYFGKEIDDAVAVATEMSDLANEGKLSIRLDTHGGRFIQGLDTQSSYSVLDQNVPESIRGYRTEQELKHLMGTGVSAASIWYMREQLDKAGFEKVKIVASSGFGPDKCRVFSLAKTPLDIIGTGSFLPEKWSETYATADIIEYDGVKRVKVGREFLHKK